MRFKVMRRGQSCQGLSLVELLIYLAILGMLSVGVATSIRYFQTKSLQINQESQLELAGQTLNALLRAKLTGGNTVQLASGYTSPVNGNYCYQISENKPVSFASAAMTNGALFQYRVSASSSPLQNAEPKLASTASLGLSTTATAANVKRSLSIWVKLTNVDGNNRVLFEYSAEPASTSYKMVVSVVGGNTVHVGMGGTTDYVYSVSNIRNGEWHHLVVLADNLSNSGSSPSLYVDGVAVGVNANSGAAVSSFLNNLNYKINIGDAATAPWSLGPVGFWNRLLTPAEIGKLGRMDGVNIDNAFWLSTPQASLSSAAANVTDGNTVNARTQQGFLLFKKDRAESGQTYYKIYHIDQAASCPDPAASDNPSDQGFTQLSDNTCANASGTSPILVGVGAAGQELGFQWRCNLTTGKQVAQASVVTGNTTTSVQKSEKACSFPIEAADFDVSKASFFNRGYDSVSTAYVVVDDFDPVIDLIAFEGTEFPSASTGMTATTAVSGETMTGAPSGTTATWFSNANNNVGMIRIQTSPSALHDSQWWVTNVFKKIKYKSRSDVYAADRSIVFTLGDAWPIKTCQGLGYKSAYHFYRLQTGSNMTTQQAYRDAFQRTYMGMAGYLGNLRCTNEKDQVSLRVLAAGNNIATIGAWATRQGGGDGTSSPNFLLARETRANQTDGSVGVIPTFTYTNEAWNLVNPSGLYNVDSGSSGGTVNDGSIQWRWIGGPAVDHNVIMLTDSTLCGSATTVTEDTKKGCQGMRTISVNHSCVAGTTSPACRIQQQSGGNRQYGWWHPAEPNESGSFIWMGYDAGGNDDNYWDDAGASTAISTYLLEFGDHPFDAISGQARSRYQHALATSGDTSVNLDPPNMATKKVKSVNFQYCK